MHAKSVSTSLYFFEKNGVQRTAQLAYGLERAYGSFPIADNAYYNPLTEDWDVLGDEEFGPIYG